MAHGGKLIVKVPLSWKKTFGQGIVIPHKMKIVEKVKEKFYVIDVIN